MFERVSLRVQCIIFFGSTFFKSAAFPLFYMLCASYLVLVPLSDGRTGALVLVADVVGVCGVVSCLCLFFVCDVDLFDAFHYSLFILVSFCVTSDHFCSSTDPNASVPFCPFLSVPCISQPTRKMMPLCCNRSNPPFISLFSSLVFSHCRLRWSTLSVAPCTRA